MLLAFMCCLCLVYIGYLIDKLNKNAIESYYSNMYFATVGDLIKFCGEAPFLAQNPQMVCILLLSLKRITV